MEIFLVALILISLIVGGFVLFHTVQGFRMARAAYKEADEEAIRRHEYARHRREEENEANRRPSSTSGSVDL